MPYFHKSELEKKRKQRDGKRRRGDAELADEGGWGGGGWTRLILMFQTQLQASADSLAWKLCLLPLSAYTATFLFLSPLEKIPSSPPWTYSPSPQSWPFDTYCPWVWSPSVLADIWAEQGGGVGGLYPPETLALFSAHQHFSLSHTAWFSGLAPHSYTTPPWSHRRSSRPQPVVAGWRASAARQDCPLVSDFWRDRRFSLQTMMSNVKTVIALVQFDRIHSCSFPDMQFWHVGLQSV